MVRHTAVEGIEVLTQRPKNSGLHIGEKMIPADKPIIEYRSMRQ